MPPSKCTSMCSITPPIVFLVHAIWWSVDIFKFTSSNETLIRYCCHCPRQKKLVTKSSQLASLCPLECVDYDFLNVTTFELILKCFIYNYGSKVSFNYVLRA
jgi:hypothetical protein